MKLTEQQLKKLKIKLKNCGYFNKKDIKRIIHLVEIDSRYYDSWIKNLDIMN